MVITPEPTYWLGNDDVRSFTNDALYQKKLQFIRDNNIVVWRFHDHLHARQPDMSAVGLADAIGWSKYQSKDDPRVYVLPRLAFAISRRRSVRTAPSTEWPSRSSTFRARRMTGKHSTSSSTRRPAATELSPVQVTSRSFTTACWYSIAPSRASATISVSPA